MRSASAFSGGPSADDHRHVLPPDWLIRTIESQVVPALLQGHRESTRTAEDAGPNRRPQDPAPLAAVDVDALVDLLLRDDMDGCEALVGALLETGVDGGRVCEALLAPAARRLGALWDEDRCDVTAVIQGLWRIQCLVHASGADDPPVGGDPHAQGRILVAAVPGCTHLLGAVLVAAAFRHAGWSVIFEIGVDMPALCAAASESSLDVIALCVGADRDLALTADLIRKLRAASYNAEVKLMVGGPALIDHPDKAAALGADAWARDAAEAVRIGHALRAGQRVSPED